MALASSTSLRKQLLLITFAIALCRHLREAIASHYPWPREQPEECTESAWPCPACFAGDTPAGLLNYALKISSMEYAPENEEDVTVRVYSKFCPSLNANDFDFHSLPNWFRLEAVSEATSAAVGKFERPSSRYRESYLCSGDTSIIFSTSETDPLDFPKTFTWKPPTDDAPESICFRLTLHSDRHWCQQTKTCISLRPESTSGTSGSAMAPASGEFETEDHSQGEEVSSLNKAIVDGQKFPVANSMCSQSRVDRCYKNWNCTGKKMVRFCGSNGMIFNSRCERRLWQCLTNKTINISSRNFTACMPSCDGPSTCQLVCIQSICHEVCCRQWQQLACEESLGWEPRCTRKGLFKLVQCDKEALAGAGQCWCVYSTSSDEVLGTRGSLKSLNCTDSESYMFDFAASYCPAM